MSFTFTTHDYLALGSIGFHQLGDYYEYEKRLAECSVLQELITSPTFVVPEFLTGIAWLKVKTFHHEYGSYDELCIIYDYDRVNSWEQASEEEVIELFDRFWDWVNRLERFNWECPDLLHRCEQRLKSLQKKAS